MNDSIFPRDSDAARCPSCRPLLSEYLDDQLDREARARVDDHLSECADCQALLEDLERVRSAAGGLGPLEPPRDLWPAIRTRLGEAEVVPLRTEVAARPSPWRRRVRLTIPQLAAAGLVLAFASGLGAWTLRPLAGGPDGQAGSPASLTDGVARVSMGGEANPNGAGDAVDELDAVLREARDRLDPNTVRILEKNLGVIDRAIAEARAALEMDPGNRFLEDHLRTHEARRLEYLRQTTALLERSS